MKILVLLLQNCFEYDIMKDFNNIEVLYMIKYDADINKIMLMIKHIMLDKNITQKDICNATGWSKGTVSNLLNGRTENPSLKIILQLCDAIECDFMIDIVQRK